MTSTTTPTDAAGITDRWTLPDGSHITDDLTRIEAAAQEALYHVVCSEKYPSDETCR